MTQEIRKDLSVAAIMATMVCAALLLISARAAAEHVGQPNAQVKNQDSAVQPR
jgi:hypothetical protein